MDEETYRQHLEVVRYGFRNQFDSSDKLAVLDCVRWCEEYGLPLPSWALKELSGAVGRYLSGDSKNFHLALLGPSTAGRHGNPLTRRRYQREHQLWFDLVCALRKVGFKGDRLYEQTQKLLETVRISPSNELVIEPRSEADGNACPDTETIRERIHKLEKARTRPSGFAHLIPMMIDITADRTFPER